MRFECDSLVIGTGLAGLTYARCAAAAGQVLLLTKESAEQSATNYAQGGVASVHDAPDSFEAHIEDTIRAGRGLCDQEIVELCVRQAPECILELQRLGVRFTTRDDRPGELDLGREGGHSFRRIVHAADATGREVVRASLDAARTHPAIDIREGMMAVDLIVTDGPDGPRCKGAYVLEAATGDVHTVLARTTVLATGGAGKVYLYTSNPDVATGDGIAMAHRAGAEVRHMEFYQFHPTLLYHPTLRHQLVTEALRGEGAVLRDQRGRAFMTDHDPAGDLAPRDIVARAIDLEMKRSGDDHVLLDATGLSPDFLRERFPSIRDACARVGLDLTTDPIPVVPAAHYCCGGVVADRDGRTSIAGLFAIGETACTGLHGANRLASNSLLECLVFAHRAAAAAPGGDRPGYSDVPDWEVGTAGPSDESVVVSQDWDEIRRYMWNYVGIVRSDRRLHRAQRRQRLLDEEIAEYYWKYYITPDLLELRNIATVASLIIEAALARRESRGLHYNTDAPVEAEVPV